MPLSARAHADVRAGAQPGVYAASVSIMGTGIGQSCAFCGSPDVVWSHPLAEDPVAYREYGKGHKLPSSWALCERCEEIYSNADDDAAVRGMRSSAWAWVGESDI